MMPKQILGLLFIFVSLGGCVSGSVAPDWQVNVQGATERGIEAYLTGRTRIEESEFVRARAEIARTGDADLIARVELVRCAIRVASLVLEDCVGFDRISQDTSSAERVYADYLAGRLPPVHQRVLVGGPPALQTIKDPLSRLVAAGVLFKNGQADPAVIAVAIDTASGQGWSRPLLAWLQIQSKRAELADDVMEVARIRRHIDRILQTSR